MTRPRDLVDDILDAEARGVPLATDRCAIGRRGCECLTTAVLAICEGIAARETPVADRAEAPK